MTNRDARERLAKVVDLFSEVGLMASLSKTYRLSHDTTVEFVADLRALLSDQPLPSATPKSAVGEQEALIGPWCVWFDPPPIGTRECDWHYQHEDAEPECPAWMHGHCASRDACIAEIIDTYEERLP